MILEKDESKHNHAAKLKVILMIIQIPTWS